MFSFQSVPSTLFILHLTLSVCSVFPGRNRKHRKVWTFVRAPAPRQFLRSSGLLFFVLSCLFVLLCVRTCTSQRVVASLDVQAAGQVHLVAIRSLRVSLSSPCVGVFSVPIYTFVPFVLPTIHSVFPSLVPHGVCNRHVVWYVCSLSL